MRRWFFNAKMTLFRLQQIFFYDNCPGEMKQKSTRARTMKDDKMVRCTRCHRTISALAGTFFANGKIKVNKILEILWRWTKGETHAQIVCTGCSSRTVSNYFNHIHQLISDTIDEDAMKIGGPGEKVQIDESKFVKRKYHLGHRVGDKSWIFGGIQVTNVEVGQKKPYFSVMVHNRKQATLQQPLIKKYIRPGTHIVSDGWAAYQRIGKDLWNNDLPLFQRKRVRLERKEPSLLALGLKSCRNHFHTIYII